MACRLIDRHQYRYRDKKPELPRDPMCVPVKLHRRLLCIKAAIITVCVLLLIPATIYLENLSSAYFGNETPLKGTARTAKHMPTAFVWIAGIVFAELSIAAIEKKSYANLQDHMKNPRRCKYQGRTLSKNDPHYQLHLNWYKLHKSWILPDGMEESAYENADGNAHISAPAEQEFRV